MIVGAFERPEGPEDISPPPMIEKSQRPFESVLAAQVLHSKLGRDAGVHSEQTPANLVRGAGVLQKVKGAIEMESAEAKSDTDDAAIDCLLSLSSAASSNKRTVSRLSTSVQPAPRRRLKMRSADLLPAPALEHGVAATASSGMLPPRLPLLSSATVQQLSLLAAAFKLCPTPSAEQLDAISARVQLPSERLRQWFESRQVLQDWMNQQPELSARDVMQMFYPIAEATA